MTQRGVYDIPQVRRSKIGDVDMARLGDTLTHKRPVWSTFSAKPKGAWRPRAKPDVPYGHREQSVLIDSAYGTHSGIC